MLPQHEEQLVAHELYPQNSVAALKHRLEQELLLLGGTAGKGASLDDEFVCVAHEFVLPVRLGRQPFWVRVVADDLRRVLPKMSDLGLK